MTLFSTPCQESEKYISQSSEGKKRGKRKTRNHDFLSHLCTAWQLPPMLQCHYL